nr:unnamed protein product [Spirometra erinaceieuropaei]
MEHRVGAVVTRLCLTHRWSAGWWWNVASASSRRGSAWYAVDQPVGWISELAPLTRAHLVHRRRPQACGNAVSHWQIRVVLPLPKSGIDRNSDTATTSNTLRPILAPPSHAPTTTTATTNTTASSTADTDTADLSCPHCPRTFTSRIGLVGHLRIHRTETGEPVPGAPTYTHGTRLHCPHCPRTFTHRMGLFGHMRIHNDLR